MADRRSSPGRRASLDSGALTLGDLPIPASVTPDGSWSEQMHDLSVIIGPRATLMACDALGGVAIYLPNGASRTGRALDLARVIGAEAMAVLVAARGGTKIILPRARYPLARARRGLLIAHARAGTITISTLAAIIGATRDHAAWLVNHSEEGRGIPLEPLPEPRSSRLLTHVAGAAAQALTAAQVPQSIIDRTTTAIVGAGSTFDQERQA